MGRLALSETPTGTLASERRPHSDPTNSPLQEDALEEATAPALRPAGHGVHYAVAGTAEHLAVGPVK